MMEHLLVLLGVVGVGAIGAWAYGRSQRSPAARRSPSPHEHLLREHEWTVLGEGARRVCYRIGDTGFCVKFMRDPATSESTQRFGWRFRYALKHYRFDPVRNINCREAAAFAKYRSLAGPLVAAAMPEIIEVVRDDKMGFGILMSYLCNADGSAMISADFEMAKRGDPVFARACADQISKLLSALIDCAAPFFEPDNFEAQLMADGSVRIRMIDFEPTDKKLIPVGEWWPWLRRLNLRRKASRYLRHIRAKYGII